MFSVFSRHFWDSKCPKLCFQFSIIPTWIILVEIARQPRVTAQRLSRLFDSIVSRPSETSNQPFVANIPRLVSSVRESGSRERDREKLRSQHWNVPCLCYPANSAFICLVLLLSHGKQSPTLPSPSRLFSPSDVSFYVETIIIIITRKRL